MGSQNKSCIFNARPTEHARQPNKAKLGPEFGITHPYPNFLILNLAGYPQNPPQPIANINEDVTRRNKRSLVSQVVFPIANTLCRREFNLSVDD